MNRRDFLASSAVLALESRLAPAAKAPAQASEAHDVLRRRLMEDPLRPQFHLIARAGFVGDPCAPHFFRGNYHVFFHGNYEGKGWAHAISSDLVHWKHLPIALSPTAGSFDEYGTFTGGVLPDRDGRASIVYTGVTKVPREQETIRAEGLREVQCIASSADEDLRTWTKRSKPIILAPPTGMKVTGFRDPFGWKNGDTWYVAVGSGFPQVGGAILLYRSRDMEKWEYVHPLAEGTWNGQSFSNPVPSGEMWECPDFFALGAKHVVLYSTEGTTWWEVGTYNETELRFHSEKKGVLDHGAYYAPRSMADGQGRRVLWGWVQETRDAAAIKQAGWSGCVSLPRVLTLAPDNSILMDVAPELARARQLTGEIKRPQSPSELATRLAQLPIKDRRAEIVCTFVAGAAPCTLDLQLPSSIGESTSFFKAAYSRASGVPFIAIGNKLIPVHPDAAGFSTLHVWIDGSVIEAFLDSRQAITTRCYATLSSASDISIVWSGPATALENLSVFRIESISEDRLTT